MRRIMAMAGMCLFLILTACSGSSAPSSASITLGVGQFTGSTTVSIQVGGTIKFDDASGGSHNLVTGSTGLFAAEQGAPSDFVATGIPFNGGDVKTITFSTAGVYHITCTLHPSMQATITVTAVSQGGNGY